MKDFYRLSVDEVINALQTSEKGLSKSLIPSLQERFGKNVLKEAARKSKFAIFLSQLKDTMIIILIVAAGISFFVGEHTDAFVILAIIIANAVIGFVQEYNAEESVRMLQKMAAQEATVLRENDPGKVDASDLVPGDIILLEAGDIVPADARLIKVSSLKTEEAALTGESQSVEKITDTLTDDNLGAGDQLNMVFKGTTVSNGSASAVVTSTGMNTEIGKIAGLLNVGARQTPLQKRLAAFSKQLAVVVIVICLIVFGSGLMRGEPPFLMFLTALSLAVAALPEALPAVITVALSNGARRMVNQKALIRKLPAVETLGSVTFICSDKTGTLTQNVMTVEKLEAVDGKDEWLKHAMMLNNEVRFSADGKILGDSTETALVQYVLNEGGEKAQYDRKFPLKGKLPFDSVRMRMSTLHEHEGKWVLFVKGAPIRMVEALSDKYKDRVQGWLDTNRNWAGQGLRVLFFAYKVFDRKPEKIDQSLEQDLVFLGMAAMIDPPREEVVEAIGECKTAGIRSVMITGDQPLTAFAIAKRLNITDGQSEEVKTGADLEPLSVEELTEKVENISVYARVSPEQKLNIVKALQKNDEFVAMTGDGVNDAPSLKQADIGVAMGITGTDVSKEAADMILLDDNFATIVKAVKEGRRIYENIKKFILYVLSCNLAEILIIFFTPLFGLPIPLLPIHILWINLVTDGLPGLALTAEPAERDIMSRPPRPPKESLFAGGLVAKIGLTGVLMAIAVILTQMWAEREGYDVRSQQTIVFTLLCFVQLGNALSVRAVSHSIFSEGLFANKGMWLSILLTVILQFAIVYVPVLQPIFLTTALEGKALRMILIATVSALLAFELIKLVFFRINRRVIQNK